MVIIPDWPRTLSVCAVLRPSRDCQTKSAELCGRLRPGCEQLAKIGRAIYNYITPSSHAALANLQRDNNNTTLQFTATGYLHNWFGPAVGIIKYTLGNIHTYRWLAINADLGSQAWGPVWGHMCCILALHDDT